MSKNLFLTGKDWKSNSMLLRSVLGRNLACAGGYLTERTGTDEDFTYTMYPAPYGAGYPELEGEEFFHFSYTDLSKNTEVFRNLGTQLLYEAVFYPFAVIDQFGGFELLVPEFRAKLEDLLNSEIPVIGVLLSPEEMEETKILYGLGDKIDQYQEKLHSALKKDPDTLLLSSDNDSPARIFSEVSLWSSQYAKIL